MASPLDTWAMGQYGVKSALLLQQDQQTQLYDHVKQIMEADVKSWKERDDRMLDSQSFWEIGSRKAELESRLKQDSKNTDEAIQAGETVELNDGFLIVDKITNMGAGAGWYVDVVPRSPELTDTAQDIEDFLSTVDRELDDRYALGLNSSILRSQIHYAALRGWITGMILPNPEDESFPFQEVLEDPMLVYPKYSRDRLIRVTYRYKISMLEAMEEFPILKPTQFGEYKEDNEVEVSDYFDDKYRLTMVTGAYVKNSPVSQYSVVRPLAEHGYLDIDGKPINPWIIVTPRGTPTRRTQSGSNITSSVKYIGLDVLHPVKEMIRRLEKLSSMLATEIAKGPNPPIVYFYDGINAPEPIDTGVGGRSYMIIGNDFKTVDSSVMKPDAGPYLQILTDHLQRGSLPSVLYGEGGGVSGYAINLLSQAAKDIMEPILDGVKLFRKLRYRRMLEMYYNHGSKTAQPMPFQSMDRTRDMMFSGAKTMDPGKIKANGVQVDVRYDELTPRDRIGLAGAAVMLFQNGLMPLYDILKDYLGVKDPRQALQRLAEGLNYKDPEVMNELKIIAGQRTGSALLQEALKRVLLRRMAMIQMQQQQGGGISNQTNVNGEAIPPIEQVGGGGEPANVSPMQAAANQMNDVGAVLNAGQNGASAPVFPGR